MKTCWQSEIPPKILILPQNLQNRSVNIYNVCQRKPRRKVKKAARWVKLHRFCFQTTFSHKKTASAQLSQFSGSHVSLVGGLCLPWPRAEPPGLPPPPPDLPGQVHEAAVHPLHQRPIHHPQLVGVVGQQLLLLFAVAPPPLRADVLVHRELNLGKKFKLKLFHLTLALWHCAMFSSITEELVGAMDTQQSVTGAFRPTFLPFTNLLRNCVPAVFQKNQLYPGKDFYS